MISTGFCEEPKKQEVYDKKKFLLTATTVLEIHQWYTEKPHFLAFQYFKTSNVFNLATHRKGGNTGKEVLLPSF